MSVKVYVTPDATKTTREMVAAEIIVFFIEIVLLPDILPLLFGSALTC